MSKPRHVVLMGLMGSGKSTLGVPLAARRLGRQYVDNDRQLELRTGQTAHELAAAVGMDELHRDEAATLLDSLARDEPAVHRRAHVRDHRAARSGSGSARSSWCGWIRRSRTSWPASTARTTGPRWATTSTAVLMQQYAERAPLYRQIARLVVHPADGTDVQRLVEQIATAVTAGEAGSDDGRR